MSADPPPATLGGMEITVHAIHNPDPVDTGWVDDALAGAGDPLGAVVARPLTPGDGIMLAAWPDGSAPADRDGRTSYHVVDSRPGRGAGPATYLQVVTFEGPRTDAWVEAEERAATGRLWPATRDIAGIVRVIRARRPDGGLVVAVLAESVDAIDESVRTILSTALLPDEDPALLTPPDHVGLYRLVHADLPTDLFTDLPADAPVRS